MKVFVSRCLLHLAIVCGLFSESSQQNVYFTTGTSLTVNTYNFATYTVLDSTVVNSTLQCYINTACSCSACNGGPSSGPWFFVGVATNSSCYINAVASSIYQAWNLVRTLPSSSVEESFTISCCACDSAGTSVSSATLNVIASLPSYVSARNNPNVTDGTYKEATLYQAGYVEWGPCTCDMTPSFCDINCCCDTDCSSTQITEEFTGCAASFAQTLYRSCSATPYTRNDYSKLMCVLYENNAIAGYVYSNISIITSENTYSTTYQQGTNTPYLFTSPSTSVTEAVVSTSGSYIQNLAVKAVMQSVQMNSGASAPLLSVPQPTLTWSSCSSNVPIQVLKPFSSVCVQRATQTTCNDQNGVFSYLSYIQANALAARLYDVSALNGQLASELSALTISSVAYYTATTAQVTEFLEAKTLSSTACWDYATSMSARSVPSAAGTSTSPCVQTFSDRLQNGDLLWSQFTAGTAAAVSYNTTTPSCLNAVLAVEYNFGWTGQNLSGISAKILLGTLPINPTLYMQGVLLNSLNPPVDDIVVNQRMKVNFTYLSSAPSSASFLFPWNTSPYNVTQNSGTIGYQFAMPVVFSVLPSNGTSNITWTDFNSTVVNSQCAGIQTTYASTLATLSSYQQSFYVIRPNGIGMCSDVQQQPVVFRQNMMGSCKMRIDFNDMLASGNCQAFNASVISFLSTFMPFSLTSVQSWVSINGNPSLSIANAASNNNQNIENQWIPVSLGYFYQRTIPENATGSVVTNASQYVFDSETSYSLIRGICQGVVTGANLVMYYQSAGKQKNTKLYQIVGSALQYTFDDAAAFCVGPQSSQVCRTGSSTVQDFMVTTSVQWVSVSASDSGPSFLTCWYDVCFGELFWLFNPSYYIGEAFTNVLIYGLTILFGFLAMFLMTRPWY